MSELRKVLVNFFPKIYESCFVDRLVPPFPWDGGIRRSIYIYPSRGHIHSARTLRDRSVSRAANSSFQRWEFRLNYRSRS